MLDSQCRGLSSILGGSGVVKMTLLTFDLSHSNTRSFKLI
jgi:hypothetical protein